MIFLNASPIVTRFFCWTFFLQEDFWAVLMMVALAFFVLPLLSGFFVVGAPSFTSMIFFCLIVGLWGVEIALFTLIGASICIALCAVFRLGFLCRLVPSYFESGFKASVAVFALSWLVRVSFGEIPWTLVVERISISALFTEFSIFSGLLLFFLSIVMAFSLIFESFNAFSIRESLSFSLGNPDRFLLSLAVCNLASALLGGFPLVALGTQTLFVHRIRLDFLKTRRFKLVGFALFIFIILVLCIFVGLSLASVFFIKNLFGFFVLSEVFFLFWNSLRLLKHKKVDLFVWFLMSGFSLFLSPHVVLTVSLTFGILVLLFKKRKTLVYRLIDAELYSWKIRHKEKKRLKGIGSSKRIKKQTETLLFFDIKSPLYSGVLEKIGQGLVFTRGFSPVLVLGLRQILFFDESSLQSLRQFYELCKRNKCRLLIGGIHTQPYMVLAEDCFDETLGLENFFGSLDVALEAQASL